MSEYIAEVVQNQYGEATILKEKLTRCKDCKYLSVKWSEMWCDRAYDDMFGEPFEVEESGFCAWAERKRE